MWWLISLGIIALAKQTYNVLTKEDETLLPRAKTTLELNLDRLKRELSPHSGPKIAILGEPGAGKSSLLKIMTKEKVSPRPEIGTKTDATNWSDDSACNLLSFYKNYVFVDVPGYDTKSHPADVFLSSFPFDKFDVLVFVMRGKLKEDDEKIFSKIAKSEKSFLVLRSYSESLESDDQKISVENDFQKHLELQNSVKILFFSNKTKKGLDSIFESIAQKAAEQGNAVAQFNLGECYRDGEVIKKDETEAAKWYRKAAEQGHAEAQLKFRECVVKDQIATARCLRKEAEQGNTGARFVKIVVPIVVILLIIGYFNRPERSNATVKQVNGPVNGVTPQVATVSPPIDAITDTPTSAPVSPAVESTPATIITASETTIAAKQEAIITTTPAHTATESSPVVTVSPTAIRAPDPAVTAKHATVTVALATPPDPTDGVVQHNLGWRYYSGTGTDQNKAEAVKWWRKAAEQGYAKAQFNLGLYYYGGDGDGNNKAEAVKWWQKAAEQGLAEAQINLGLSYESGIGNAKDLKKAVEWISKAAEQGLASAQYDLGNCYLSGIGRNTDQAEAVKWHRKAAEQGYAQAQYNLGLCLVNGWGVAKDEKEAGKWISQSYKQGFMMSQYSLSKSNLGFCSVPLQ